MTDKKNLMYQFSEIETEVIESFINDNHLEYTKVDGSNYGGSESYKIELTEEDDLVIELILEEVSEWRFINIKEGSKISVTAYKPHELKNELNKIIKNYE